MLVVEECEPFMEAAVKALAREVGFVNRIAGKTCSRLKQIRQPGFENHFLLVENFS